jgi:uncharacterized protein (DUF885 family)
MRHAFWIGLIAVAGLAILGCSLAQSTNETVDSSWLPPTLAEVATLLDGLGFDRFIDASYEQYLLRFPEVLTHYGLASQLGVRNDLLNDYSEAYLAETQAIEVLILEQLQAYDRSALTPAQQLTYDVCAWYWDDIVRSQQFANLDYLVTHYYITSRDWSTFDLLTVAHPLYSKRDVEDYMSRLSQVEVQFDQLIAGLTARAEQGIVTPDLILAQAVSNLGGLVFASSTRHPFYTTLSIATQSMSDLSTSERTELLANAKDIVAEQVLPAYRRLYDKLIELRGIAPQEIGYGEQPDGLAYYDYALRHQNQTDLTAPEIHELGLAQVARLQTQIYDAAIQAGYSEDLSISQIYAQVARDSGFRSGDAIVEAYEEILERAKSNLSGVFNRLPRATVVVVPDPTGGYYRASNGSRPAEFAAPASGSQPYYSMPTLTYHETIPGHHLQIALASELPLPLLRKIEVFLGFTEGWALYSERLAWELGWYEDDVYGNFGRLSDEMMRAVRLVVDTGIHAMGWTYNEAVDYFASNTGKTVGFARSQVQRYIVWPGQSTSYMIGFLRILELRDRMQQALGDAFDLADFHSLVLEDGSMPLEILERRVQEAIDATL